jgi:hypothetical protein
MLFAGNGMVTAWLDREPARDSSSVSRMAQQGKPREVSSSVSSSLTLVPYTRLLATHSIWCNGIREAPAMAKYNLLLEKPEVSSGVPKIFDQWWNHRPRILCRRHIVETGCNL